MKAFIVPLITAAATSLKFASVSDIHLMPMYDAYNSNDNYCWQGSGSEVLATPAFFG